MHRLLVAACLVLALSLRVATVAGPTPAHADNTVVNAHYTYTTPLHVVNPCNGETVDGTFTTSGLVVITRDAAGGFHGHIHDMTQARGVGETTGVKYVGTDSGHRNDNITSGGTMTSSFNDHFPFVSQGSAPNFVFYVLHHVTTNADGTVTASVDNMRESCKG